MKKIKLENLVTKTLGKEVFYYRKIDSTQKEIWRRIVNEKIQNGTMVIADIQTAGIGTHGRTWYTSQKAIAEILVDIFKDFYKIDLKIKSPNDLIINRKKVGGILTETRLNGENVKDLVIGIGINITKKDFEEEIKDTATSIYKEFKIKVDNERIITEFCNRFEKFLFRENIGKEIC